MDIKDILNSLDISDINNGVSTGTKGWEPAGELIDSFSPVDGQKMASVKQATKDDYEKVITKAQEAFKTWRTKPAPARGELVRKIGNALREKKQTLGTLVSYEMGKSLQEGYGEVQEMIDICDFAVGQSRQLYGLSMHSERPEHRMYEQWHPLGVVGVISAFNFPVAVWAWNSMIALVCGDVCIWKPSSKVPLCAIATHNVIKDVLKENDVPEGVLNLVIGKGSQIGDTILEDKRISLISATGSVPLGRRVATKVAERLGKSILELGGNNGIIITANADLDKAMPAVVFGAIGTTGQRCTSTRRLIIHESVYDNFKKMLVKAYEQLRIGNPLDENSHVGPLIDTDAVNDYTKAIAEVEEQGGKVLYGGSVLEGEGYESGCYVVPCIAEVEHELKNVRALTTDIGESDQFLSQFGSDCGIVNVNIVTSGAEIGGAFGGEKETGGGREAGSDAWKGYMRRQTNTINFGKELPLAQGIKFEI